MRISWTQAIEANPDLDARWRSAVSIERGLSLISAIEVRRRTERLNALLFNLERDFQIEASQSYKAYRIQRGIYWIVVIGLIIGVGFQFFGSVSLFYARDTEGLFLVYSAFLLVLVIEKEKRSKVADEANLRIESYRNEFHDLAGVWLFRDDDLKLLKSGYEDEGDSPRLAEIIVESQEFLVERASALEESCSLTSRGNQAAAGDGD